MNSIDTLFSLYMFRYSINLCFGELNNIDTNIPMQMYTHICQPYRYEHLRTTKPENVKVQEITIRASMLMSTLPTIKRIALINLAINL